MNNVANPKLLPVPIAIIIDILQVLIDILDYFDPNAKTNPIVIFIQKIINYLENL